MWIKAVTHTEMVAEIATLKAQVESLRTTLAAFNRQMDKLEEALAAERARSDSAVDRMLGQHGLPPVTPIKSPTLDDLSSMFEEDPAEVRAIKEAIKERGAENVLLGTE